MKVALIRNNPYHGTAFKKVILSSGHQLFDVTDPRQIAISKIGLGEEADICFYRKPITYFDRIVFLHSPFANIYPDKEDNVFGYCEIDAALISAMNQFPDKIFNLGTLRTNRSLLNAGFLMFKLKDLGWEIHDSFFCFQEKVSLSESMTGNLMISRATYVFSPFSDIYIPDYEKLTTLILKTQQLMWDRKLDLINLKFVYYEDQICLYAFSLDFEGINEELFSTILMEVL